MNGHTGWGLIDGSPAIARSGYLGGGGGGGANYSFCETGFSNLELQFSPIHALRQRMIRLSFAESIVTSNSTLK